MSVLVQRIIGVVLVAGLLLAIAAPADAKVDAKVDARAGAVTAADAREAATRAIGAGDGKAAAGIIAANGLATQPAVLGRIIYEAGILAVRADLGEEFSVAVATAFVDGGVSFATANLAFVHGVLRVVAGAPGDKQLLAEIGPGGIAVLRTELAYLGISPSGNA